MTAGTVSATSVSAASPETVFAVVADARRWREWTFMRHSSLEREGVPPPDGIGAIRRFGTTPFFSREEIVEYEPPRRLAYVLLSGLPLRSYRAEVELTPDGSGTAISWRGCYDTAAATAPLARLFLGRMLRGFAERAARQAERVAARR